MNSKMVNLRRREETQKSPNMIDHDQCHVDTTHDDSYIIRQVLRRDMNTTVQE